jgi:hypothetical protein
VKTFNQTVAFLFELGIKLLIVQGFALVTLNLLNLLWQGGLALGLALPDARTMAHSAAGKLAGFGRKALGWLKNHRRLAWLAGLALALPALVGLALVFPAGRMLLKTAWGLAGRWWAAAPRKAAQWVEVQPLPVVEEVIPVMANNGRY